MVTFLNKEGLTTKLTLIIVGLTAGSGLLIPATYASFHPVTSGEIADNTIRSVDIENGQVTTADIADRTIRRGDVAINALSPNMQIEFDDTTVGPNNSGSAIADCPSGYRVTGGGFFFDATISAVVHDNRPVDQNTWQATLFNNHPTDSVLLQAYAVCMGPIPP